MTTRFNSRLPFVWPDCFRLTGFWQAVTGLLALWLTVFCFPGNAFAVGTATPSQLSLVFNATPVGVTSAQQLTASFSASGGNTLTAELHYGIDYNVGAINCTSVSGGGQTCTVPVTFSPTLPGARKDALFLKDGATILAIEYLDGSGQSPLALLQPGIVTPLVSGATYEQDKSTVDENGTVYVISHSSPTGSNVYSVTKAGVVSVIPVNVNFPDGIAIDGAGILYISPDAPGSTLVTWNTVTQVQGSVSAAIATPYPCAGQEYLSGVGVDAQGDVYTLELNCQSIIQIRPNGTTVVNAISPAMNANPHFIAVDSIGNVFFSCVDIINEQLANGSQSAITNPGDPENNQLEVDAADTLYVVPHSGGGVVELPPSNYQTSQTSLDPTALISGIGLSSDGTLYVGNLGTASGVGNGDLDKVDRSQGTIAFGQQAVGTASASQSAQLYNGGNESLTLSNVALTGTASGYALQTVANNGCSSGLVLVPGAYCQVVVSLTPAHVGNLAGSIVFSTNSLNKANSTETVALSGFVPGSYATLSPNPVAFTSQEPGTTSSPTAVILSNTGTVALTNIVVSLTGANTSDFSTTTGANACGNSLAVGANCSIYVTFKPLTAASYAATLSVADGATNSPQTAALTGAGVPPPAILQIDEVIHTTDAPGLGSSISLNIVEVIHTSDVRALASSASMNIAEIVHTTDDETPMLETPVSLNIAEVIHTTDTDALTITVIPTQTSLSSSVNPSLAGQTVTFTATVSSGAGNPVGTVQFNINGTAAGAPASLNTTGQAVYSTTALADGNSSITAAYSGSGNFSSSTSQTLSQSVLDFAFATGSTPSQTISPGQSATFQFALSPQGTFGDTITFSASGLPPGATASFDPASVTPSTSSSMVTMTVQTAQLSAALYSPWRSRKNSPLLLGILLPLFGTRRLRRALKRKGLFLTAICSLGIVLTLVGCGSSPTGQTSPQTYTITVTATGGSLQHSTTVNLTVQ